MRDKPRVFYGKALRPSQSTPDPYAPGSPGFAERNRRTEAEVMPGLVVVSLGAPIQRLPGEAQPVDLGTPEVAQEPPQETPEALPAAPVEAMAPLRERNWRDDYGLAKRV